MSSLHVLDTTATGLHKKGASSFAVKPPENEGLIEETIPEDAEHDGGKSESEASDSAKENDEPAKLLSDKKTDEQSEAPKPRSLVWRLGSGLYSTTTGVVGGAVGVGTGSVKWVAGKSYSAGSAVLSTTVNTTKTIASYVPKPTFKKKDKKE